MRLVFKKYLKLLLVISEFTPLALIYLVKSVCIDWLASRIARYRLPSAASELGLTHQKSNYIKEFGKIHGIIRGHEVTIEPFASMNPVMRVKYVHTCEGLEIALQKPRLVPKKNIIDFTTPDRIFNNTFKTRRAHQRYVENIRNNREVLDLISRFYRKWIFRIDSFIISGDDIFCRFRYGFHLFPYIPSTHLAQLVNELIDIAGKTDEIVNEK